MLTQGSIIPSSPTSSSLATGSSGLTLPPRPKLGLLRELLRDGTQDVHTELENATIYNRIIATPPSKDQSLSTYDQIRQKIDYANVVDKFHAAAYWLERSFERRLAQNQSAMRNFDRFGIPVETPLASTLIAEYLLDHRIDIAQFPVEDVPLPRGDSFPAQIGLHYVWWGSRFGGTMIAKVIELHLGEGTASRFLNHYGDDVKKVIQAGFDAYEKAPRDAAFDAEALKTARETFLAITKWQKGLAAADEPQTQVATSAKKRGGMFSWLRS